MYLLIGIFLNFGVALISFTSPTQSISPFLRGVSGYETSAAGATTQSRLNWMTDDWTWWLVYSILSPGHFHTIADWWVVSGQIFCWNISTRSCWVRGSVDRTHSSSLYNCWDWVNVTRGGETQVPHHDSLSGEFEHFQALKSSFEQIPSTRRVVNTAVSRAIPRLY